MVPVTRTGPGDQDGLAVLHCTSSDQGREGGEIFQANPGSLLVAEFRGHFHQRLHGDGHKFGMAAVPAKAEIPAGAKDRLAFPAGIPGNYPTGKVASGNPRRRGFRHFPQDILHIAGIDGRGQYFYQNLTRLGHRHGKLCNLQIVQRAGASEIKTSQNNPFPDIGCNLGGQGNGGQRRAWAHIEGELSNRLLRH